MWEKQKTRLKRKSEVKLTVVNGNKNAVLALLLEIAWKVQAQNICRFITSAIIISVLRRL
jgi:hypothetical protein